MEEETTSRLQQFATLIWYDELIEFIFRFVAKTSEPLLALGVVFSAADVLSKGSLMQGNPLLLIAWAWAQAIAIESSGGVVLVYALQSFKKQDTIKGWLYLVLSVLLSLVGATMLYTQLVANMSGTTEIWASAGVTPYVIGMSILRSVVSIGYVVMCRTKHISFTNFSRDVNELPPAPSISSDEIRSIVLEVFASVQVSEQKSEQLQLPVHTTVSSEQAQIEIPSSTNSKVKANKPTEESEGEQGANNKNYERVKLFLLDRPNAKVREVAQALEISPSTANKWMQRVREE